jgi:hypothetical protein
VSDRRAWARCALERAADDLSKWDLDEKHSSYLFIETDEIIALWRPPGLLRAIDDPQQKKVALATHHEALWRIATDHAIERIVARFGYSAPLRDSFLPSVRRDREEVALRRMLHQAAFTVADPHCVTVSRRAIVEANERTEAERAKWGEVKTPADLHRLIESELNAALRAPLDDPIVSARQGDRMAKRYGGVNPPSAETYLHARGVLARLRSLARDIFTRKADADVIAAAFATAATRVSLSRDDLRTRPRRKFPRSKA